MSGIATVLVEMGHRVSGSDLRDSPRLDALRDLGVTVSIGHDADEPAGRRGPRRVLRGDRCRQPGGASRPARAAIPVWSRTEALRAFAARRRTVAVAGSHGKTTTTAMLTLALREAGWDPSHFVGGDVPSLGGTAAWRAGEWLVVEADESDGTFLAPRCRSGDRHQRRARPPLPLRHRRRARGGLRRVPRRRRRAVRRLRRRRRSRRGWPQRRRAPSPTGSATPTTASATTRRPDSAPPSPSSTTVTRSATVELPVPGRHNAANAAAAAAMAVELGAPFAAVQRALRAYTGVARRFELRGVRDGVTYVDDYAHLPTEVSSMIDAAREGDVVARRRGVPAAPLLAHRRRSGATSPTRSPTPTSSCSPTCTASTSRRSPGVSGHLVLRAVLDAHPDSAGRLPADPRRSRRARARASFAPATSCSRSAPATSRRCPTSGWHDRGATASRPRARSSPRGSRARSSATSRSRAHDVPPRGTGRVAGARRARPTSWTARRGRRGAAPAGPRRGPRLEPPGRRPGLRRRRGGARRRLRARSSRRPTVASSGAGGAVALPVLARRAAAAGLSGLEFFVGIPGSVGGAVRMNAGGHGRETAEVLRARDGGRPRGRGPARTLDVGALGLRVPHARRSAPSTS